MAQNTDTKDRILDAAERLFADQGIGSTSLRNITSAAKVNLAAVHYHFGSKDELLDAVYERRLVPMNAERLRRLEALRVDGGKETIAVSDLVEAFVRPALELSRDAHRGGHRFIKLLGRTYTEPDQSRQGVVRAHYESVVEHFKEAFAAAIPALPKDELYWRMHFMVGTLAYCMAGSDLMRLIASCRMCDPLDSEALISRLTDFLTAGMQSPAGQRPLAEAATRHSTAA